MDTTSTFSRTVRHSEGINLIQELSAPGSPSRQYKKGRFLGKGAFGRVYEMYCFTTNSFLAGKVISKLSLVKPSTKQKLLSEIKIHKSLNHKHIVAFKHFFEDCENVYILLELCKNQTLRELLKRRKRLTELEVKCYISQLISAIQHLHSKRIIHRDIKIGNVFLNNKMEIKLGDFGLSCKLENNTEKRVSKCGTPNYLAPEILEGGGYSYKVDVWSVGVMIYTLLVGKLPFETNDVQSTYKLIRMNAYYFPENLKLSCEAMDLISKMLIANPSERLQMNEVLSHAFFNTEESIPKSLPTSTMVMAPSKSYLFKYQRKDSETTRNPVIIHFPTFRANTAQSLGNSPQLNAKLLRTPDNRVGKVLLVNDWVNYSGKYGIGYLLSSGHVGACFNDGTQLLLQEATNSLFYKETGGHDLQKFSIDQFPNELNKKVAIVRRFRKKLQNKGEIHSFIDYSEDSEKPVYVKKWIQAKKAVIFRLSSRISQVIFTDMSQIVVVREMKLVIYVNSQSEHSYYSLHEAAPADVTKRMNYTKKVLESIMKKNFDCL